jgi:RimJ/RimL family protein N-acetyltransferase
VSSSEVSFIGARGGALRYRPIEPGDKAALLDLFARLSPRSRHQRFLSPKRALSDRELAYFTEVDHRTHEALAAVGPHGELLGVARYACPPGDPTVADLAFAVADDWHGHGIGTALARLVVAHARRSGITRLHATTAVANRPARRVLAILGFRVTGVEGSVLELRLDPGAGDAGAQRAA